LLTESNSTSEVPGNLLREACCPLMYQIMCPCACHS
jgi:hypothetical protein